MLQIQTFDAEGLNLALISTLHVFWFFFSLTFGCFQLLNALLCLYWFYESSVFGTLSYWIDCECLCFIFEVSTFKLFQVIEFVNVLKSLNI